MFVSSLSERAPIGVKLDAAAHQDDEESDDSETL